MVKNGGEIRKANVTANYQPTNETREKSEQVTARFVASGAEVEIRATPFSAMRPTKEVKRNKCSRLRTRMDFQLSGFLRQISDPKTARVRVRASGRGHVAQVITRPTSFQRGRMK